MADITVSTFGEFLAAGAEPAGTYDNIICPEDAVWDMNEIDPDNTIQSFRINANVTGNNTELRNYRGGVVVKNGKTVSNFNFINMFSAVTATYAGAFASAGSQSVCAFYQCKFSLTLGSEASCAFYNVVLTRCSVNIACQRSGGVQIFDRYTWNLGSSRYNREKIEAPNMTANASSRWEFEDSEIIIDAPFLTKINASMTACTIRGNLDSCTGADWQTSNSFSVLNSTSAPNYVYNSGYAIKLVTDAQMRDISYLNSIGFRIGSE